MLLFVPSLATQRQGKQAVFTRSLTIDHTQVPSTQTNFPVLVSFINSTFKTVANGGHVVATNAFTFSSDSDGANLLSWEVERYDATTGEIVAWVKIASVSSVSDTVFYLRYGGTITTDGADPTNVWTNSFLGVYHLKDGTTLSVADSRGVNNGTNNGATAATGQIDGGAGFASVSSQYVQLGASMNTVAITYSCWLKGTTFPNDYNGVITNGASSVDYKAFFVKSNGKLYCVIKNTTSSSYDGTGSHTLSAGTWYLVHLTYDSSAGLKGYVNAASDGTAAANGDINTAANFTEIGRQASTSTRFFNGVIDEARVASVARSADWITCEYNNQQTSSTFVALGAEA